MLREETQIQIKLIASHCYIMRAHIAKYIVDAKTSILKTSPVQGRRKIRFNCNPLD